MARVLGLTALLCWAFFAACGGDDDDDTRQSPTEPVTPTPSARSEAEQIIAEGGLESYAATESGTVLTVWERPTCDFPNCEWAWRLGSGSQPQATGMIDPGDGPVDAIASGDGFIVTPASNGDPGFRIAQDGTASPLSGDCRDATWSTPTEPGRLVWTVGLYFVDTVAGVICDTGQLGGRPLARGGVFTADGTLWAMVDNETGPDTLTIGRYDGVEWRYHDFAAESGSWTSVLAAGGSNVVVLHAAPASSPQKIVGFSVTTDAGATWSEVVDPDVLERDLPFYTYRAPGEDWYSTYTSMAFAGPDVLYVADSQGGLWRSTDLTTFSRVPVPGGGVGDLKSAGDAVIARTGDEACPYSLTCPINDLVRISADGSVESITAR